MRVMIDTNILFSWIFFRSPAIRTFQEMLFGNHHLVLCSHVIKELWDVVGRKFPTKSAEIDRFLRNVPFEMVYTPKNWSEIPIPFIRDPKDAPILATTILENVDVFVTGDKDFLSLDMDFPAIMTMADFVRTFGGA